MIKFTTQELEIEKGWNNILSLFWNKEYDKNKDHDDFEL